MTISLHFVGSPLGLLLKGISPLNPIAGLLLSLIWLCACPAAQKVADAAPREESEAATSAFGFLFEYLNGNSTYHISAYDPLGNGVESELEFPLNTFLLGLETGIGGKDRQGRDTFRLDLSGLWTIGEGSGKMKDSDWATNAVDIATVGSAHPGKDIYSESDASLTGEVLDLHATFSFWSGKAFAAGPLGGYRYEHFDYTISNLRQVGYGPYASGYTGSVSGKVLDYEVTYTLPYIGVHSELVLGETFRTAVDLGYSPIARAWDTDDHVLRTKRSKGDAKGQAVLATLTARWNIKENDYFTVRGSYLKIDTNGTQTQTWYGNADAPNAYAGYSISGIRDNITSRQISFSLLLTHRF